MRAGSRQRRAEHRRDGLADMSVHGYATGSNFYPHAGVGTSGVPLQRFSNCQTVIPSPSKSNSLEKNRDSSRKVKMPIIRNVHQKVRLSDILTVEVHDGGTFGPAPGDFPEADHFSRDLRLR